MIFNEPMFIFAAYVQKNKRVVGIKKERGEEITRYMGTEKEKKNSQPYSLRNFADLINFYVKARVSGKLIEM